MFTRTADMELTELLTAWAADAGWVASDKESGAYLIRQTHPLAVGGEFYTPWFKLVFPITPPGDGRQRWRPILTDDLDAAIETAEKMLTEWLAEQVKP